MGKFTVYLIIRYFILSGSEFLDVKQAVSDTVFKKFENVPVYADQNYHDDNSWPRIKRHSISFTDYRRAKTYSDKNRLQSIENVEKERLMAIYDVPPRRIRKVESEPNSESANVRQDGIRSFDVNFNAFRNITSQSAQGHENYLNWTGEFNNNVMSYQVPMTSSSNNLSESRTTTTSQSDSTSSLGSNQSLQSISQVQPQQPSCMLISASAPFLCGFGNQSLVNSYKNISQSLPGQIAEELVPHRDEVMRSLDQSEQDLEKEMSLLDEMLQV